MLLAHESRISQDIGYLVYLIGEVSFLVRKPIFVDKNAEHLVRVNTLDYC